MFIITALSIWAAMNAYVFFRLGTVNWISDHVSWPVLAGLAVFFTGSFPLARVFLARGWDPLALPFEYFALMWVGVAFLLFSFFLIVDIVTLGGWFLPSLAPHLRSGAALAALAAAILASVQAVREPMVRDYELHLPGLPESADGYTFVAVSDLHLGTILGEQWLEGIVSQINALEPQAVLIAGDVVDGDAERVLPMAPVLGKLEAPDGVWAVTGNHDFYAGLGRSVSLMEEAGIGVLRDRSVELIPGLVLAGVDDFAVPLGEGRQSRLDAALAGVPPESTTILLSHTPEKIEAAAAAGVDLMLCGHTHNGQIWPFNWIVRTHFRYVYGHHQVEKMNLIVSSGVGTWGPRMRLWSRGEILRIRIRAAE